MITHETQKYGKISATKYQNGNYLIDNGMKRFEISENEFEEIVNNTPLEIKEEDIVIGLTHSPAVKSEESIPQNYWTLEIKNNPQITTNTYIKYKNKLYLIDFIKDYSSHNPPTLRLYCL